MSDLLLILSLATFSWMVAGLEDLDRFRPKFKPFNCPMCMGLWIGLIVFGIKYGLDYKLFYATFVMVLSNELDRWMQGNW